MTNNIKVHKKGFTLMETLVAIVVLSIAIAGPLTIAQKGLQAALISKDQITSFYLAQDAIEYIRYARDTNCLVATAGVGGACPAGAWLADNGSVSPTNLTSCVSTDGSHACTVDVIAQTQPSSCSSSVCTTTPINYDSTHNYFTYVSGSASIFTRTITITSPVGTCPGSLCNPNEAAIVVTVSWKDPIAHSVMVKENLFDWQ